MELTEQQRKLQERLAKAAGRANDAAGLYARLKAMCKHVYAASEYGGAYCAVCQERGGWYCPDSPDHLCKYSKSYDWCDFCGEPEERK